MSGRLPAGGILLAVVVSSVALAAVSLLVTDAIAFDPEAWIVWARELFGPGYLTTGGGPAWKPLPVLVIGPLTWITRGQADVYIWLLIAGAVLAHDAGARRTAAVLTFAAALVRPEVWPFALIYGVWLVGRDRRRAVVLVACVVVVVGAWAVPELLHTGATAVGAATGRATRASARYAAFPFLDVFEDAFDQLTVIPGLLAGLGLVAIGVQVVSAEREDCDGCGRR